MCQLHCGARFFLFAENHLQNLKPQHKMTMHMSLWSSLVRIMKKKNSAGGGRLFRD